MKIKSTIIPVTLAALLLTPAVLQAAGSSSKPQPPEAVTPEQQATVDYNEGLEHRDRAWELEEEAAAAMGEKAEKKMAKARKSYEKAIRSFRAAVRQKPDFHEAWSSLGYALRKTGDYEGSLAAYDRALTLDASYVEAIEYRGEAYLGLNRIEDAKDAYMQLFRMDRERAAELMTAMKSWLNERREDAGGVSTETIEGFATWVEERSELVAQLGVIASVDRSW